jgi:hypothetical protein
MHAKQIRITEIHTSQCQLKWKLTECKNCHLSYRRPVEHCIVTGGHRSWKSLGLWTLPIVQYSKLLENTTFRKLDLFQSSGKRQETPTLFGSWGRKQIKFQKLWDLWWTKRHYGRISESSSVSLILIPATDPHSLLFIHHPRLVQVY